jgi:hypothetical protein
MIEIHIRFAQAPSPEPRPVRGSRFMRYTRPWSVSPARTETPSRPHLRPPSFGSGNGISLGRLGMRIIKVVALLGVVIAIAVWMLIYFSPYNSCIREGWSQEICERGKDQPN